MIVMTKMGLEFHTKIMKELTKEFSTFTQTIVKQIDKLEGELLMETRAHSRATLAEEKMKGEFAALKSKVDALKKENEKLSAELFILENPEKVAEEKKLRGQKENEKRLNAFASNVTWGSM